MHKNRTSGPVEHAPVNELLRLVRQQRDEIKFHKNRVAGLLALVARLGGDARDAFSEQVKL